METEIEIMSGEDARVEPKGPKPDFRIVQPEFNGKEGKVLYRTLALCGRTRARMETTSTQ
ncbi:MAG: hypothetical protein ABIH99_06035 [Candidatus Micrarchaeota archaeon]